jgi:hypothetical protein
LSAQLLRITIAGLLSLITTSSTVVLAVAQVEIPQDLGIITIACLSYLFGVTTNGSGLGTVA